MQFENTIQIEKARPRVVDLPPSLYKNPGK